MKGNRYQGYSLNMDTEIIEKKSMKNVNLKNIFKSCSQIKISYFPAYCLNNFSTQTHAIVRFSY